MTNLTITASLYGLSYPICRKASLFKMYQSRGHTLYIIWSLTTAKSAINCANELIRVFMGKSAKKAEFSDACLRGLENYIRCGVHTFRQNVLQI